MLHSSAVQRRGPRPARSADLAGLALLLTLLLAAACSIPAPILESYAGAVPPRASARLGKGAINVVTFSPDGTTLAVGGDVGVYLYRTDTLEEEWSMATSHPVSALAFSPDGTLIASGLKSGVVILIDAATGVTLNSLAGNSAVDSLAWSGSGSKEAGTHLAIGFNDGLVLLSSITGSAPEVKIDVQGELEKAPSGVVALAYSPNHRILASGNRTGLINLWDTQVAERVGMLRGHKLGQAVLSLSWSPNGAGLVSGSRDGHVIDWDVTAMTSLHTLAGAAGDVVGVAYAPDGKTFSSASENGTVFVWDADTAESRHTFETIGNDLVAVAWSPAGSTFATASTDGTLSLWDTLQDAAGDNRLRSLRGHTTHGAWVESVAWSPDGTKLASGSGSKVMVWDAQTERPLHILERHTSLVSSVAWSPDGKILASGGRDRHVIV